MKMAVDLVGALLLTVLYSFLVVMPDTTALHSTFPNKSITEKERKDSKAKNNFIWNCSQSDSLFEISQNESLDTFEKTLKSFFATTISTECLLAHKLVQYTSISRNLLIKYRKADMIFPFQYFW